MRQLIIRSCYFLTLDITGGNILKHKYFQFSNTLLYSIYLYPLHLSLKQLSEDNKYPLDHRSSYSRFSRIMVNKLHKHSCLSTSPWTVQFSTTYLLIPPYPVSTHRNDNEETKARDHDTIKNVQRGEQEEERGEVGRVAFVPRFGVSGGSCPSERTRDAALPLADTRRATRVCTLSFPPHPSCRPSSLRCTPVAR